ncbi:MAG: 50S ribosomal protein L10 [Chitinophagales bacterium]|nr:MAG: 50S ribosomal protein L10 [Chitinophagales bacterium]
MNREEKQQIIEELKKKFSESPNFYVADTSGLTVGEINALRRLCYESRVEMRVAKNTLIYKALEVINKQNELEQVLKGQSTLFFTEVSNSPAKIIKKFREKHDKPILKAACIDSEIYTGDEQLEVLANLKSKSELIGEVIGLLQSPARNVLAALLSGKDKLAGILKTLSEKEENNPN